MCLRRWGGLIGVGFLFYLGIFWLRHSFPVGFTVHSSQKEIKKNNQDCKTFHTELEIACIFLTGIQNDTRSCRFIHRLTPLLIFTLTFHLSYNLATLYTGIVKEDKMSAKIFIITHLLLFLICDVIQIFAMFYMAVLMSEKPNTFGRWANFEVTYIFKII